jgi:ribose transport system permease protein
LNESPAPANERSRAWLLAGVFRPWLVLFLVCTGFSLSGSFRNVFWSTGYLPTIPQQAATNIVLSVGMTFVILTGGIDLSVGSVLALSSVTLGLMVKTGPPPFLSFIIMFPVGVAAALVVVKALKVSRAALPAAAISGIIVVFLGGVILQKMTAGGTRLEGAVIAALLVGCSCGLLNGLVVTLGRVPPFVVTLGMFTAARGLTVYATNGNSVSGLPERLGIIGTGFPLILIALVVVVLGSILLSRTRTGRYFYSIGGNEEASHLSGVDVIATKTLAYTLSGLTAAIAAVLLTAKFMLADTSAGMGSELNAIAAVVIGGTSLSGGQGSVVGSLVGALTFTVLSAGLVLTGTPDTLQGVVIGAVIVLTVMVDRIRRRGA